MVKLKESKTLDPVCFLYMPYSGGKFLANCLALSRHVLCMKEDLARLDVYWQGSIDTEYYAFKLKSIMTSLPESFSKIKSWADFEFSDNLARLDVNPLIKQRLICHTAHSNEQLTEKLKRYPQTRIIKLVNYRRFNEFCFSLKSPTPDLRRHKAGYSVWDQNSKPAHFEFDTNTIFSLTEFPAEMKRLYDFLDLDDFQPDLITQFHWSYLDCHKLT